MKKSQTIEKWKKFLKEHRSMEEEVLEEEEPFQKAVKKGWKLSQHGLFDGDVNLAENKTEEEIFELLGATYLEPSKR